MKRFLIAALALCAPVASFATTYTYTSTLGSVASGGITHGTAYTASITGGTSALDTAIHSGAKLTSGTITISGLYDWTAESLDKLYVDLLNGVQAGTGSTVYDASLDSGIDTVVGSDPFLTGVSGHATSGTGSNFTYSSVTQIGSYTDLDGPATTTTLVLNLTGAELTTLDGYLNSDYTSGADLGLGLGPDCHFYDSGISISFSTPDHEMTVALLGLALLGLAAYSRRSIRATVAS
jgi:hypothetical protein